MVLVHEYYPKTNKRFVVELTERELQLVHAALLWLPSNFSTLDEKFEDKVSATEELWSQFHSITSAEGIRTLPVVS